MKGGPRNYLVPTEPNENKGGFRKIKRGEGKATVFGGTRSKVSDRMMTVLGWGLLCFVGFVVMGAFLAFFIEGEVGELWSGVAICTAVIAHFYLIAAEMITHRELPTRGWAMGILWGGGLLLLIWGVATN